MNNGNFYNNNSGYPQQTNAPVANTTARNAEVIGGWTARQNGLEFGKYLEFMIERVATGRGGTFETFTIYKPYVTKSGPNAGKEGKGFSFPFPDGIRTLVDCLNKLIAMYAPEKGMYIFQPMPQGAQYGAPVQPQAPQPQSWGAPVVQVQQQPAQPQYNTGFEGYPDYSNPVRR